jgi:L-lactate dehydrogenase
MVTVSVNEKTGGATDRSDPLGRLRLLDKNAEVRSRDFANAQFCVDVDISASPHPLHDVGNSFHGAYLVELPGHRVLSNQAGFPKLGEGR